MTNDDGVDEALRKLIWAAYNDVTDKYYTHLSADNKESCEAYVQAEKHFTQTVIDIISQAKAEGVKEVCTSLYTMTKRISFKHIEQTLKDFHKEPVGENRENLISVYEQLRDRLMYFDGYLKDQLKMEGE